MRARRGRSSVRWVAMVAVAAILVVAGAWGVLRLTRPVLTVTEVVEGPVVQAFYATGTVEPFKEYPIKANLAGTLTEVKVDKGDAVRKGDVLAVVTDPEMAFKLGQAKAELEEKRKMADEATSPSLAELDARLKGMDELFEIADRERVRVGRLRETNSATQTDLDRAMDRYQDLMSQRASMRALRAARKLQLERDLAVAQAGYDIATWNVQQQTLTSPIDGVVLNRPTSQGTRVAINDSVMVVADVRPANLVMRAAVDEEDVTYVREGQGVRMTLYAFGSETFSGKVTRIYDQADEARRTFEVDVRLDRPSDRLAPGMTGELAFILQEKAVAKVVPSQAVQADAVWIVRDGRLARTMPEIGVRSVERTEIVSGLEPGTLVVLDAIGGRSEGQSVRTTYLDPQIASGVNKEAVQGNPFKSFD